MTFKNLPTDRRLQTHLYPFIHAGITQKLGAFILVNIGGNDEGQARCFAIRQAVSSQALNQRRTSPRTSPRIRRWPPLRSCPLPSSPKRELMAQLDSLASLL